MIEVKKLLYKYHLLIVIFIIILGSLVRVVGISSLPIGLNQDEASTGYDAYSILTTGHDRIGNTYPVQLESWGNGQYALYAYLSMPFVSIFGLNTFSIRIVNAIFGIISLLIFYLIFRKYFNKNKALFALFLFAINPWSIMASRWGLDCNLFPPIVLIGVFFLLKAINYSSKYFAIATFFFAISLYSYGTSYLFIPVFLFATIIYLLKFKHISLKLSTINLLLFLAISIPIILCVIINHFDLNQIQVFNVTIPKLAYNRTTVVFNLFSSDFFSSIVGNIIRFSSILFLQTDGNEYNAIPTFGTFYLFSLPFVIIGLISVLKNKLFLRNSTHFIFFSWFLTALLLGCCIHPNINRTNIIIFPILYFNVLGFFEIGNWLRSEFKLIFQSLVLFLYLIYFGFFIGDYSIRFNDRIKENFSYGLGDAIICAEKLNGNGTIHITNNSINMPYIYACFYNKINPNDFLKTVVFYPDNGSGFRDVRQFGKYSFGKYNLPTDSVYILSSDEVTFSKLNLLQKRKFGNFYVFKVSELNKMN